MKAKSERADAGLWNPWRIARWGVAAALVATPAVMMQFSDEWDWGPASFVLAGTVIGSLLLLYEFAARMNGDWAYRAGVAIVLLTAFLTVWSTIVRDDGTGAGFFLLIMAAGVGAFAAWFEAGGMARAMLGVAIMQALYALAIATAPVTARVEGAVAHALVSGGIATAMWLIAAALFWVAARR